MMIESEIDHQVGEINVDLFVPAQQLIIQLADNLNINFDKRTFGGQIIIKQLVYQLLDPKLKVITVNQKELQS